MKNVLWFADAAAISENVEEITLNYIFCEVRDDIEEITLNCTFCEVRYGNERGQLNTDFEDYPLYLVRIYGFKSLRYRLASLRCLLAPRPQTQAFFNHQ